ncbi:Ribonuclease UK114 [Caligus rogercresseyi]|uniref:Ribonuclease UK114 n=1 Tax=Caligus rogercresseyi TaxID=217165 RepID=A0A7T8QUS1_CALRO|nr:Ribonuclease UK114 [Caligus rogercresseyi]
MQRVIISTARPLAGNTLYISGQIGLDPNSMEVVGGGVEGQARQVLKNLGRSCQVLKTTVLLKSMDDFGAVNKIYSEFFSKDPQQGLPMKWHDSLRTSLLKFEGLLLLKAKEK